MIFFLFGCNLKKQANPRSLLLGLFVARVGFLLFASIIYPYTGIRCVRAASVWQKTEKPRLFRRKNNKKHDSSNTHITVMEQKKAVRAKSRQRAHTLYGI